MKIHGLDLDNSPLISQDKSLRYAQNIAIGEGNQSYINEDGFELKFDINNAIDEIFGLPINNAEPTKIIGTIPTNIGVVLFCICGDRDCIIYIKTNSDDPIIDKICYTLHNAQNKLNFDSTRPIHGDYIYNYKEELIVTFTEGVDPNANETRVINLTSPYGGQYDNNSTILYKITDISSLNLIPDVEYPEMTINVDEGGNLKTGAYQIAISYKLQDGTYTNYSILSVPVIVCGNYGEDYAPNSEINRKIIVSFDKPDISYNTYKLGIVHCNGISQDCYETEDIILENELNIYTISNLNNYNTIVLDDIFIKNISYIREKTLVNYNNRLIRGNVQTLNYKNLHNDLKTFTKNNLIVTAISDDKSKIINTNDRYFKFGEAYVLFAGYFDYKGDLINIYHIPNKFNTTGIPYITSLDNNQGIEFLLSNNSSNQVYIGYNNDIELNDIISYKGSYKTTIMGLVETDSYFKINSISSYTLTDETRLISIKSIVKTVTIHGNDYNIPCIEITNNADVDRDIIIKYTIQYNRKTLLEGIVVNYKTSIYTFDNNNYTSEIINNLLDTNYNTKKTFNINEKINIPKNTSKIIALIDEIDSIEQAARDVVQCLYKYDSLPTYNPILISNDIYYKLAINIEGNISPNIQKYVKSVAYFYIEHNTYNSRILSQALCVPDTNIVNFASNQEYKGQFEGKYALRFYPFEYLYNKISKLKANIQFKYNIGTTDGESTTDGIDFETIGGGGTLDKTYIVQKQEGTDTDPTLGGVEPDGVKILDCDINDITLLNNDIIKDPNDPTINKTISLEYISNDNTSQQNIAGDSYYRTKDLNIENYPNAIINKDDSDIITSSKANDYYIADIINPAENLYSNLDNQKLQIASPIIPINSIKPITLTGDTFLSYLTLRLTTPAEGFRYGDSNFKEGDSNATVFRWIFTFPIESKYNIIARYSDNIIDKPYFLHDAILQKYVELLGTSYKVDNYINTNVGKGYNPVYNENGIEQFTYYKEIPGTSNHPYRIIRSLAQNPESISLNWRTFKTDDYKDLPFNRGEIISLKTDNKNLYIQQKYGLHLLQQRDQLNNDDANNSYLGTSDLFNMEPKEIVYSPSGYIGCESYFDTNINIAGYVVIDAVHKKIFLINGDKPLEISNIRTREYFEKLIDASLINPYNKQGRIINYNEDRNILYITQINGNDVNGKTMSFSPLNKAWVSFHTYIPDLGFVNRNGLFWGKNGILYQPNSTIKGKYFGTSVELSVIQFILNENTIYNKLLKTIVWKDQVSYKGDNYIQHFFKETINHIMVHNFDQCSGELDVVFNSNPKEWWNGDTGTNKINLWRFNKLFDLVTNPENPFMIDDITPNYANLKWKDSKPDYKWYKVNRFICQFIYLTMWCDNTPVTKQINGNEIEEYHEWELIDVHPEWQLDNRNDQTYGNKDNNQ